MMPPTSTSAPVEDLASLSPLVRWKRALQALGRVLANPEETDQVLVFSSYINAATMTDRMATFFAHPDGMRLYTEQATIDSKTVDLAALLALPDDTLGHAYATFLTSHGLTPDVFDGPPEGIADPRASYVIQRMRQTHDLWHVVTGSETDPAGEIALQAFTHAQTGAPSSAILAAFGTLRWARTNPEIARSLVRDVVGAYRRGKRAEKLVLFGWERHWTTPLAEVRAMLGLPTTPAPRAVPLAA